MGVEEARAAGRPRANVAAATLKTERLLGAVQPTFGSSRLSRQVCASLSKFQES